MKLLKIGKDLLRANGFYWTALYITYWAVRYFFKIDLQGLYGKIIKLEERHNLPGFNTPSTGGEIWDLLPWEKEKGENWTLSAQWKKSLVDEVLLKYIKPQAAVLEIGPGAGRWTEILQPVARELFAVDVSAKAIDICTRRFSGAANIKFFLTRGSHLDFIPSGSIGAIWSFDVFVHINPEVTDAYISEFKRVLVPGGVAIIHHPKEGCTAGGCRSRMTAPLFLSLLQKHGLTLVRQFDSWGDKGQFNLARHRDCISVFSKP